MTSHDEFLENFPPEPRGYRLPPEGFEPHLSAGGFSRHNGPFYQKLVGEKNFRGFYVLDRHCNSMGIAHGGLLVSFTDALLGLAVYRVTRQAPITVRIACDFVASAKRGDWVEGEATVIRAGKTVIFASARVYVEERVVLVAQSVFKARQQDMSG